MKHEIKNFFLSQINEHKLVIEKTKLSVESNFLNLVNICVKSLKNGKKNIFSETEECLRRTTFVYRAYVRFCENRKSIPAISLVTDTSAISAIGNDYGFKYIFSRQLEAIGQAGDVAIGITTSGKSHNVLEGLHYAKDNKMKSVAFTGRNIKQLEKITDEIISIPAKNTSRIQEAHILIGQMLCNALEFQLGLSPLVNEEKI